jgi:hypothetical protein
MGAREKSKREDDGTCTWSLNNKTVTIFYNYQHLRYCRIIAMIARLLHLYNGLLYNFFSRSLHGEREREQKTTAEPGAPFLSCNVAECTLEMKMSLPTRISLPLSVFRSLALFPVCWLSILGNNDDDKSLKTEKPSRTTILTSTTLLKSSGSSENNKKKKH